MGPDQGQPKLYVVFKIFGSLMLSRKKLNSRSTPEVQRMDFYSTGFGNLMGSKLSSAQPKSPHDQDVNS